jgi:hypothetical protein
MDLEKAPSQAGLLVTSTVYGVENGCELTIHRAEMSSRIPPRGSKQRLAGRPTKYRPEYDELAKNYCLLGAVNSDLASFFDVSLSTIEEWIRGVPSFATAIKGGRVLADAEVASKLYSRAVGYSYIETQVHRCGDKLVEVPVKKHLPPDVTAAFFWLKNRRPDKWRDRVEPVVTAPDEAARRIREFLRKAEETTAPPPPSRSSCTT